MLNVNAFVLCMGVKVYYICGQSIQFVDIYICWAQSMDSDNPHI